MADNKSWDYAHKLTAKTEGGVSVDKTDKGNQNTIAGVTMYSKTYYGLTLEAYAGMKGLTYPPASKKDFKKLNKDFDKVFGGTTSVPVSSEDGKGKVKALFKKAYWDKHKLGGITDKRVAASIYDALVNQGLTFGNKGQGNSSMLNTLKRLGIDTSAGFKDLDDAITQVNSAIKDKGGDAVLNSYAQTRENSYIKSSGKEGNKKYSRGWVNRLNDHRTDTSKVDWQKLPKDTVLTSDSISKARVNTNYDVITATVPGEVAPSSAELTQEEKDQIAIDIQPTPVAPGTTIDDQGNVTFNHVEIAKTKEYEINRKNKEIAQPEELKPLSDLTEEEISNLTSDQRKKYGLTPVIDVRPQEELEVEKDVVVEEKEDEVIEKQEIEEKISSTQTQEIEVIDANGNLKTITVPFVEPIEEPKDIDKIDEEEPKPIKPKLKDFKNSTDYMRARMKYYDSIESKDDNNEVEFENQLNNEEIKEVVEMEQNVNVLDVAKRNIFKTKDNNNIFNSIIGDINKMAIGVQQELNNFTKSLNNKE